MHANTDQSKYPEINEKLFTRRLRDAEHRATFVERYPILEERPELWNWFDIFDLDDEDYAVVKADPVPADQEALTEQAIAECPRAALVRED